MHPDDELLSSSGETPRLKQLKCCKSLGLERKLHERWVGPDPQLKPTPRLVGCAAGLKDTPVERSAAGPERRSLGP